MREFKPARRHRRYGRRRRIEREVREQGAKCEPCGGAEDHGNAAAHQTVLRRWYSHHSSTNTAITAAASSAHAGSGAPGA